MVGTAEPHISPGNINYPHCDLWAPNLNFLNIPYNIKLLLLKNKTHWNITLNSCVTIT